MSKTEPKDPQDSIGPHWTGFHDLGSDELATVRLPQANCNDFTCFES